MRGGLSGLGECFGLRSARQVLHDYAEMLRDGLRGVRFQGDVGSAGLVRPDLSLVAYAGLTPRDGLAPVYNLFDRVGGGRHYSQRVSRRSCRDFRGGRLSYDEHDGTDLVCPVGTPLGAAAPGVVVMIRQRWLRGGLTVTVDHGAGLTTQCSHCWRALAEIGQVVRRGEPIALSGASGVDLVTFFPWVPPHVHFLVMHRGRPVDPYRRPGEPIRPGGWLHGNQPRPGAAGDGEQRDVRPSAVNREALERAAAACRDPHISRELAAVAGSPPALAALLEDALCHDAWAWPAGARALPSLRPDEPGEPVRLTLPLPASDYRGARLADVSWTRPPR